MRTSTMEATQEPARGRPARSTWYADRFSECERAFRRVAAATGTVARRFMVRTRGAKTRVATHEPQRFRKDKDSNPFFVLPESLGNFREGFMVSMRGRRTVAALPEPQFSNVWVVFTACLLFSQALWAAHGIVHTLDGKNFEGEFALENGAITVTATNGTVERIALATLALLKVQPPAASVPAVAKGNGNGLLGMYYNSTELAGRVIARLDETVDFSWGLEAPMAGINRDYFSVRWTGEVEAPVTGEYRFFIQTDDGGRLWVDEKLLIDQWHIRAQAEGAGRIQLEGGKKYEV